MSHAATSRKREPIQGDEEAGTELKLGEFQDVDALTHSEAALVINALVAKRKMDHKNVNDTEYGLFSSIFLDHKYRKWIIWGIVIWASSMLELRSWGQP
jgi:DNA-directed RNA polymerase II subunit RPB4